MPKYYCDYCNIYLTHDTLKVRRDHNSGWKHALQVKNHFMLHVDQQQLQWTLDDVYREYAARGEAIPPPPGVSVTLAPVSSLNAQRSMNLPLPPLPPGVNLPLLPPGIQLPPNIGHLPLPPNIPLPPFVSGIPFPPNVQLPSNIPFPNVPFPPNAQFPNVPFPPNFPLPPNVQFPPNAPPPNPNS